MKTISAEVRQQDMIDAFIELNRAGDGWYLVNKGDGHNSFVVEGLSTDIPEYRIVLYPNGTWSVFAELELG